MEAFRAERERGQELEARADAEVMVATRTGLFHMDFSACFFCSIQDHQYRDGTNNAKDSRTSMTHLKKTIYKLVGTSLYNKLVTTV